MQLNHKALYFCLSSRKAKTAVIEGGRNWDEEKLEEALGQKYEEELKGSPKTSFPFLSPVLVKRPISSVGWNLSDFSPRLTPSGACRVSLYSFSLPFVTGYSAPLLTVALALWAAAASSVATLSFVWRSRLA